MPREMLVKLSCGYCATTDLFPADTAEGAIPGQWVVIAIPSRQKQELYCCEACARPGLKLLFDAVRAEAEAVEPMNVTQMPDPASGLVGPTGAPLTPDGFPQAGPDDVPF